MFQLRLLLLGSSDPLYGHWEQEELEIGALPLTAGFMTIILSYIDVNCFQSRHEDLRLLGKCLSSLRRCVKHPSWGCCMVKSCFSNKSFVIILLSWDIIADSFHVLITTQWDLKAQLKLFHETKTEKNIFNFVFTVVHINMDFLNFSNIFTSVLYALAWFAKAEICSLT